MSRGDPPPTDSLVCRTTKLHIDLWIVAGCAPGSLRSVRQRGPAEEPTPLARRVLDETAGNRFCRRGE